MELLTIKDGKSENGGFWYENIKYHTKGKANGDKES